MTLYETIDKALSRGCRFAMVSRPDGQVQVSLDNDHAIGPSLSAALERLETNLRGAAVPVGARGSGNTTRAMQAAPKGAVFVWCTSDLSYPKALAAHLGRDDLKIVGASWIQDQRWQGLQLKALVKDPDLHFTSEQWECWNQALTRVRGAKEK